MTWLAFVAGAFLSWGVYGAMLHQGQVRLGNPMRDGRVDVRLEAFNVLNRANFGVPELRAFAGQRDNEAPLATFGRISNTVTSARQMQLGVRLAF